jgi:phosphoribosylformylglycinamidine synthase subunit PurSL
MGIPTVNGAILTTRLHGQSAGLLRLPGHAAARLHRTEAAAGRPDRGIGGRTGRDGLRGATFSSMEMDHDGEIAGSAVQIGHPIIEKQVLEVVLLARDEGCTRAITDCGAGGFSSAVGEMGEELGATGAAGDAPLKYPGLRPWEIWLSEAQERMVLAVPPANWPPAAGHLRRPGCGAHGVGRRLAETAVCASITASGWSATWTWISCTTASRSGS